MAQKKHKFSKKEQKAIESRPVFATAENQPAEKVEKKKIKVSVPEVVSVKDLADRSGLSVTEIISELIKNGVMANINENIDFETAGIIGDDLGLEIVSEEIANDEITHEKIVSEKKNLVSRPPVVTIMGHVDHGKTSLLDKIRESHVAAGESGGITQHISAYQIEIENEGKKRLITFIDTPGHSAFSAMRSHGAAIADIVVLIIAADDGVMPQTKEVIESAKLANVPIIVAINKTDLPNADTMKVRQQLSEYELIGEEWGGKTIIAEVSAKTGAGIEQLLEMIILQSDLMELSADPKALATGIVIESHIHRGAGALSTILIENGTLNLGDSVAVGAVFGRVRILENFISQPIKSAGPSTPVRVAGFKSVPEFGERLIAFENDKEAKIAADRFLERAKVRRFAGAKTITKGEEKEKVLNIILRSDVVGSLEAIKKSLSELKHPDIKVKIISEGVGAISESDATMARSTSAIILGFRVAIAISAKKIIEKEKISAFEYKVIYELVDDVRAILEKMLPPIRSEIETGLAKIIADFRNDKKGVVVGVRVESGVLKKGDLLKIISGDVEVWRGQIESLRREKDQVSEVSSGTEAGVGLPVGAKYTISDKVVAFRVEETKQKI
ncbi:MAG: translation initiation factor IF-2 [Candidatus Berkelbacteria bacterium]|nr:translation initiation factor IF-2 [Candidatus Berkelbacteria bacterium]